MNTGAKINKNEFSCSVYKPKPVYDFLKRIFDFLFSLIAIILFSPIFLIILIMIKIDDPKGSVIYVSDRVGKNGKIFKFYKFRSMCTDADTKYSDLLCTNETGGPTFKMKDDPRVTRVGKFIRKTSLDELPQFFNVLKGDMSLVGPRPEVPYHVEHFKEEIPRYLVRQQVRPGCTGWAQIHGLRGDTDIAERIRYDIWYIENWTVALDIKIIFRTVFGGKMVNDEKLQ